MTKNKKKLRRAERRCAYSRTAQTLVLAGLLLAGGVGTAQATTQSLWGDLTVDSANPITIAGGDVTGVWRDFAKLPNGGNLTIADGGSVTINGTGLGVVGDGNLLVQRGGTLTVDATGTAQISQGSLTLADGANLTMQGGLFSFGDITATGTLATNVISGAVVMTKGNLNWGANDFAAQGTGVQVGGNLTAKDVSSAGSLLSVGGNLVANSVNFIGARLAVNGDLTATGAASTFNGTGSGARAATVKGNAHFGDLAVGVGSAQGELTVNGSLSAGTVTINNSKYAVIQGVDTNYGLTLGTATASGVHSAERMDIQQGRLTLAGTKGTLGQTVATKEGIHFTATAADAAKAELMVNGSSTITGGVYVEAGKGGTISTAQKSPQLQLLLDTLSVSGAGALLQFKGDSTRSKQGVVQADNFILKDGGTISLLLGGSLKLSAAQVDSIDTGGKVLLGFGGNLRVADDWTYTAGATSDTVAFDYTNFGGGTLLVGGVLTLKPGSGANSLTIDNTKSASAGVINGTLGATTLKTEGVNSINIVKGSLLLTGNGGKMYTAADGSSTNITLNGGALFLGANAETDGIYGGTLDQVTFGSGNPIAGSADSADLTFAHGNVTVGKFIDADTNGSVRLSNGNISDSMNTLTLGDANGDTDKVFTVQSAIFEQGNYTVNGKHGLAVLGVARLGLSEELANFSLNKLTLQGAGAWLHDKANATGGALTFTFGELVLTDAGNKVEIKYNNVITKTLNLGNTEVTSGNLQVEGGVWQINNITKGTGSADFTLSGGTLLLGQDARVDFDATTSKNVFSLGSSTDQYGVLGTKTGTLGSTGTMTLVTDNNAFTVGAVTAAAGAMVNSVSGKIIKLEGGDATNTLNITNGAMVTAVGDGTKFFENTAAINVGFGSGGGTLHLGGMSADGTAAGGGSFGGVITLGSSRADYGTLAVAGGNVTLSKVLINSANAASIGFEGKGVLDIQTSNDGVTYAQGITLNKGNHSVMIGVSADADYTVKGGIKVTKGIVGMGKSDGTSRFTGGVVLQGAADGAALFLVNGGANTVDSLTIAEGKSGAVNFSSSVKGSLTVNSDIDLHRGALQIGSSAMSTLRTTGTMVLGAIEDGGSGYTAGTTYLKNNSTLAANGLTVQDASGNSAGILLDSLATNLTLAMGAGGVTANTFAISNGATVNLQGAGGKIVLGASNELEVNNGFLNVGLQGNTDAAAPVTPVESHWSTDKLALSNGGTLGLTNGSFSVADLTTSNSSGIGGNIAVGADAKGTASEAFGALRVKNATFDAASTLAVSHGYAQFGSESAALDGAVRTAMTAGNAKAALVVTGKQFNLANTNLTSSFGQTRQRDSNSFGAVAAGDMEFGVDSLAFFDLGTVGQTDYAIKTVGNVYIDAGAQIAVHKDGGIKIGDSLKILETQADGIKGSWLSSNASTNSRLLTLNMMVNADHSKMDGTVGMGNLAQSMPGLSSSMGAYLGTMVRTLGVDPNSANAGVRFVSRAADYGYMPDSNNIAPTIEGAAQTAVMGATPGMTLAAVNAASSAVTTRTAFASPLMDKTKAVAVHMDENGVSLDEGLSAGDGVKNGLGLWIMPLYQSENVWGMESGNLNTGYSGDLGGVSVGADYTFADAFRVGLALNIGGGYAQSSGDYNKTDNNFNFWGVNLYGGWTQNNFGITADVGYSSNYNKLTQELPSTMQMGGDLKSDVTSYAITAGLRGEYKFETDIVDVIPHISARYTSLNVNEYDVKRGGTVFKVDETNQSIWTFPVGVTFSKDIDMNNGWIFKPQVDLSVIPATGDVKTKSTSHIPGVPGGAELETQVVDNMTYQGGLGFDIKNDNMAFGINYNIQASEHRTAHGVFGTFRYEF